MQQRFFLIIALVCLTFLGCKESSRSDFRPVTTSIEKKRFAPKTAADEKVYPKKSTDSLREESKAKTIVVDATIKRFNKNYWTHVELEPDGTLRGKALFFTDFFSEDEEQSFVGSWHTGRVSRGNSYITYYELDFNDTEWYFTERFDYLWRGKDAYTDMSQHNVEEGSTITKHYEK